MAEHKIGGHVLSEHRNGWGDVAPQMVCCVSLQDGAFSELPDKAIKVFRTQILSNHVDIAGDFDKLPDDKLAGAAAWWWPQLKAIYEPVQKRLKNIYFQPINEINNPRVVKYMEGMMDAAHKDGYKLALFGDAGDSPPWDEWVKYWVPILKKAEAQGHIYCRHAYSAVGSKNEYLTNEDGTPSDDNTGRPFKEAQYLLDQGISIPIILGEIGWHGGYDRPGYHFLDDLKRYNDLMMKYDNIIGAALWTWGNWEKRERANLGGEKTAELARWMKDYKPKFYDFSFKATPKEPVEVVEEVKEPAAPETKEVKSPGKEIEKEKEGQKVAVDNQKKAGSDSQTSDFKTLKVDVSPSIHARPAAGGLAAHLKGLIFQMAALGLHSPNVLQLGMAAEGLLPLTHELRLDYDGQEYMVQLAYKVDGPEWRAYYSLISDPTNIFVVSTGEDQTAVSEAASPAPGPKVKVQPPEKITPETKIVVEKPAVIEVKSAPSDKDKDSHVIFEPAPAKPPEKIELEKISVNDGFALVVPFRSQNGPGATKFGGDCGPTCCSMIIEAVKGTPVEPDDLMLRLGKTSKNPRENYTNFIHLEKVLRWHGIESEYKKNATISFIEEKLNEGLPIISLIHYGSLPARSKAAVSFEGWHFVILVGFDEADFYFIDPLQRQDKISLVNKKTFSKATDAQDGIVNPQQILIVQTNGLLPQEMWAETLPADIAFILAIGERADEMKIPTGDLVEAWVYTNAQNPTLIRKGNLVEVKDSFINVRSFPSARQSREENGKTIEFDTKIGQVVPGNTMVLTGEYDNGYAQVKLVLEKMNPTVRVIPPVLSGKTYDLKDYFLGTRRNVQWEIWSTRGQESLEIQKQSESDFRLVKNVNAEQMHVVTRGGRPFLARTYDSSHGDTTYYTLQDGDKAYSLWCPLEMRLGETYLRRPTVRYFKKSGELEKDGEKAETHIRLVEHYDVFRGYDWAIKWGWPKDDLKRIGNNIELKDCLLIEWVEGGEQYVLSRELGYFVAWARTHSDPNSPPFSVISEINTGRSPLKPKPISLPGIVSAFLNERGIM